MGWLADFMVYVVLPIIVMIGLVKFCKFDKDIGKK
jgi:hypothetical protein